MSIRSLSALDSRDTLILLIPAISDANLEKFSYLNHKMNFVVNRTVRYFK
jgi:hypothetical protein